MVTRRPFSNSWSNSLSLIKLKPKLQHTLNFVNILDREMKRLTKMAAYTEN